MAMERHSGNCCGSAWAGAVAGTAPAGGPSTSRNPGSYSALLLWTLGRVQEWEIGKPFGLIREIYGLPAAQLEHLRHLNLNYKLKNGKVEAIS